MNTSIDAKKLINEFVKALDLESNKEYLIKRELSGVEKFVYETPKRVNHFVRDYGFESVFEPRSIRKPYESEFKISFGLYIQSLDNFSSKNHNSLPHLEAKELAEYYIFLKTSLERITKPTKKNKDTLTLKQKILALYYLGLELNEYENKSLSKVLSQILEVGEENTRKYLSYVSAGKNEVRTKQNLQKVYQLFESIGITEISNKIKSDIEK